MKILLVNDDGFDAPGILAMKARLLQDGHDVFMMAPAGNRSGASQSLNIGQGVEVIKREEGVYSCSGSPVDCVMTALKSGMFKPDIVLSGINKGANIGTDILYSGTCGAARQAILEGIPAAALSVFIMKTEEDKFEYEAMADFAAKNLLNIQKMCVTADGIKMPGQLCVFVNINGISQKAPYKGGRLCGVSFREYVNDKIELFPREGEEGTFDRSFSGGASHAKSREYSDWDAASQGFAAVSRIYSEPVSAGPIDGIEFRL